MVRLSYSRLYFELILIGFSLILGMGLSSAFLPILSWELDPTGILVGFVSAAWYLPRIFTELPSGVFSDRMGRRRLVLFGLALSVVATVLCATSRSISQLIFARALWGMGTALYFTNSTALMFDMFEPSVRGKAVGTLQGVEFIGSFIGAPLGGLMAAFSGYSSVFYVASFMTLVSFSVAFLSRELEKVANRPREGSEARSMREALRGLRNRGLLVICIVILSRMLVMQGVMHTVFQLYLNQVLYYDVATIGLVMSVRTAGFTAATFFAGHLADRMRITRITIVGLLTEGVCFCLYAGTGSLIGFAVLGLVEGIGGGVVWVCLMNLLPEVVSPRVRGAAVGLYRTFFDVGGALGPVIFIFMYDLGRSISFWAAALLLLANCALMASIRNLKASQTSRSAHWQDS